VIGAVVLRVAGVPPVDVHGPLHYLGVMDPLCGGTRATYLLLSGDLAAAARYNPIVFPLALVAVGLLVRAGVGILRGRWLEIHFSRPRRNVRLVLLIVVVAALSVRQQLEADLLVQSWAGHAG
jgi:hypothetical protein